MKNSRVVHKNRVKCERSSWRKSMYSRNAATLLCKLKASSSSEKSTAPDKSPLTPSLVFIAVVLQFTNSKRYFILYVLIHIQCAAGDNSVNYPPLPLVNRHGVCNPKCKKNDTVHQRGPLCSFYGDPGSHFPNGVIFKTEAFGQLQFCWSGPWFLSGSFFIVVSESLRSCCAHQGRAHPGQAPLPWEPSLLGALP